MELTGRHTEVDRITTLAALPRESALVVVGDPGSGRTSVLDAASTRVVLPVVRIGVNGSEARWPLGGVTTLFSALDDPRAAAHVTRILGSVRDADPAQVIVVAHELLDTLRTLQIAPTLVLIDDLDRMDEASQTLIAFLAGRLVGTSLRVVATVTGVPSDSPLAALPSLRLEALEPDEALLLARQTAADDANDGVLAVIAEQTAGNPGALHEQLGMLRREQLLGTEPLVLPLRPTPTTDRVVAPVVAAVTGRDLDVLTRLALVPVTKAGGPEWDRDVVEDLVSVGLVTVRGQSVSVRSPLVRSYLHWRMSARDRRAAHAELAVSAAAHDPRAASWHRSFTDDVPDAVALLHAGLAYAADDEPGAAVTLAERALQVGSRTETEHLALLAVAETLLAHRLLGYAARYLAAIAPFRSRLDDVRRLRLHYSVQYLSGEAVEADELLVPADATDAAEAEAVTGLLAMVASFRAEAWELEHARDLLQRAEPFESALPVGTKHILQAARHMVDAVDGQLPPDRDLHDGLATSSLLALSDPTLLLLAHSLSLSERYRSARRVFALVLARSSHTAPVWIEAARYLSAENEVRSGDFRLALRAIGAWETGSSVVERLREPSRAIAIAWRHFLEGHPLASLEVLDRCLALRSTSGLWGATAKLHAFRGRVLLSEGRAEEAAVALEAADAIGRTVRNPTVLRHLGDLIETYVVLGRTDDARSTTARLAADHRAHPSRWGALVLARSLALVSDDTTRDAARRRALELFEPADSPFERARTLAALASSGTGPDRARLGAAAAAAYEATGLRRPLAAPQGVAAMPPAVGSSVVGTSQSASSPFPATPRSAPDGAPALTLLTPEEQAVVQKVTEGFRNREIATSLYMSQRTVELRLTQIYRKVGARSRSHLVALLG
jgi:DNA-binding CsgD family transcriptional regulator